MSWSRSSISWALFTLAVLSVLAPKAEGADGVETALQEAVAHIRSGRGAQAQGALEAATRQWPADPRVFNLLGVVYAQQQRPADAERAFRRALEVSPTFVGAHENLSRLYMSGISTGFSDTGKALAAHQAWLQADPSSEQARFGTAFLQTLEGQPQQALTTLGELSPESQNRSMALAVRFAALAGSERTEEAATAARALAVAPDFREQDLAPLLPVLAETAPELTRGLLETLTRSTQPSASTLLHLGRLQREAGDSGAARASLEKLFKLTPQSSTALVELARVEFDRKDYEKALGLLAHARDLEPENPYVHFFFGLTAVEMDLALDAEESMKKAVDLEPDAPYYRYALGAILLSGGRPDAALEHFERFREAMPGDPRGALSVGLAHFESQRFDEAEEAFALAAKSSETAAGANYHLGRIALQKGRFQQAVARLGASVDAQPEYAEALSDLGIAQLRVGNLEAADNAVHRAVELDPENYRVNLNLLFYYGRTSDPRRTAQKKRFDEVSEARAERAKQLFRRIEVRP